MQTNATFARFDADGRAIGFWNTDVHGAEGIPPDAVAISEEEWGLLLSGYVLNTDGEVVEPEPVVPGLNSIRAFRLADLNRATDAALAALKADYPEAEVLSWDQQKAEAVAYMADPDAPCPLLRAMASVRPSLGETEEARVAELAGRVIRNAEAWTLAAGIVIGRRQALEDQLLAASSVDEALALDLSIGLPG